MSTDASLLGDYLGKLNIVSSGDTNYHNHLPHVHTLKEYVCISMCGQMLPNPA